MWRATGYSNSGGAVLLAGRNHRLARSPMPTSGEEGGMVHAMEMVGAERSRGREGGGDVNVARGVDWARVRVGRRKRRAGGRMLVVVVVVVAMENGKWCWSRQSLGRPFLCCSATPLMQLWGLGIEFDASHPSLVVPFLRAAAMVCPAKACQHEVPLVLRAGDKAALWRILSTVSWSVRILLLCRHGMLMLRTCQDI